MSAVRRILECVELPFTEECEPHYYHFGERKKKKSKKIKFHRKLPSHFLQYEPNGYGKRDQMVKYWYSHICPSITGILNYHHPKHRRSNSGSNDEELFYFNSNNKKQHLLKRTVFTNAMKATLRSFNQRTDNIKLELIQKEEEHIKDKNWKRRIIKKNNNSNIIRYSFSLKVMRLSQIPLAALNVRQFCTAEVPYRVIDPVRAEFVGITTDYDPAEDDAIIEVIINDVHNNNSSNIILGSSSNTNNNNAENYRNNNNEFTTAEIIDDDINNNNPVAATATASSSFQIRSVSCFDNHTDDSSLPLATCERQ